MGQTTNLNWLAGCLPSTVSQKKSPDFFRHVKTDFNFESQTKTWLVNLLCSFCFLCTLFFDNGAWTKIKRNMFDFRHLSDSWLSKIHTFHHGFYLFSHHGSMGNMYKVGGSLPGLNRVIHPDSVLCLLLGRFRQIWDKKKLGIFGAYLGNFQVLRFGCTTNLFYLEVPHGHTFQTGYLEKAQHFGGHPIHLQKN